MGPPKQEHVQNHGVRYENFGYETSIEMGRDVISRVQRFLRRKQRSQFENIMEMAREIAQRNPAALHDLVNLLLRPYQAEALVGVVENAAHQAPPSIVSSSFFFDDRRITPLSYGIGVKLAPDAFRVNLAKDTILPWPWNRQRIASALAHIGRGKSMGKWRQDPNHQVMLWLPWGISFVGGGNHSIAAGIIAGDGEVTPGEVRDMSALLDLVECDGRYYRETSSRKTIATVDDERIAAVFEIGRLMRQLNVRHNRGDKINRVSELA
ncbi:DUF6710 family protein [Paraburkholderia phenoliruptrix]|uniref:DUF6710 family protein n=1 Tax=Paraburkholderia phenoliruptrix TaxID=252970 RepID=UPI002869D7C8|nr:DUF6710 family protein [Paraburkholderia phenoliruptrix]WMY08081.1 hypothetical protein P3F88_17710 [Paraburkholderia phenoliruptrix]